MKNSPASSISARRQSLPRIAPARCYPRSSRGFETDTPWSTLHGVVFAILCPGPAVSRQPIPLLARDDLDLAVDAVDDVEGPLEHLAFVLGNRAVFALRQHDARKRTDRFLDDVAARRDHRPRGVGERLAAPVADEL